MSSLKSFSCSSGRIASIFATITLLGMMIGGSASTSQSMRSSRSLQSTGLSLTFCPPILGSDASLWCDLVGSSTPEDYQAFLFLSNDNGATWVDRTLPRDLTYAQTNYTGLAFGFASFVFVDGWAFIPSDVNATQMSIYAIPLPTNNGTRAFDLQAALNSNTFPTPTQARSIPPSLLNASVASITITRTADVPKCTTDLIETVPTCESSTGCQEIQKEVDGQVSAKSGAKRQAIVEQFFSSMFTYGGGLAMCMMMY